MDHKYIVLAINSGGTASFWSGNGWTLIPIHSEISEEITILALPGEEACAVRETARKHSINKNCRFHIVRIV